MNDDDSDLCGFNDDVSVSTGVSVCPFYEGNWVEVGAIDESAGQPVPHLPYKIFDISTKEELVSGVLDECGKSPRHQIPVPNTQLFVVFGTDEAIDEAMEQIDALQRQQALQENAVSEWRGIPIGLDEQGFNQAYDRIAIENGRYEKPSIERLDGAAIGAATGGIGAAILGGVGVLIARGISKTKIWVRIVQRSKKLNNPFDEIVDFREQKNLPKFDPNDSSTGTVALVKIGEEKSFGVNSNFDPLQKPDLRRQALTDIQEKLGKLQGKGINQTRFLTHAEAQALLKAKEKFGTLPKEVSIYVDRPTCNFCNSDQKGLGLLRELFDIDRLDVIDSNGRVISFPK